ncbi:hypothetical protein [Pleionea sediminis]|uniref:hypothetical protein n=1 Tax=Pleionea sediminis TaxID=2569479 RepID=UPI0011854CF3|nr:hypothetical protein [Pleionea sediminis]
MFKKLFKVLLLIALIIFLAGYLGLQQLGSLINTAVKELPPEYLFTHEEHFLNSKGNVVLTNIKLSHGQYGQLMTADKLEFTPDKLTSLLDLEENIILSLYLPKGDFQLSGVTIPVSSLANTLRAPSQLRLLQIFAAGCGDKNDFKFSDLLYNDITELNGELELKFDFDSIAENLEVQSSLKLHDFASFEWQFEFNDVRPTSDKSPYLVYGQWIIFNPKFLSIRDKYCAYLNDQPIELYKKQHYQSLLELFKERKIVASEELKEKYQQFIQTPENLAFTLNPLTGIRLNEYQDLNLAAFIDKLGVSININGRAVESIIDRSKTDLEEASKNESEVIEDSKPKRDIIYSPSLSQLRALIGERIMLMDENRKEFIGKIKSVSRYTVKLEIRESGGFAEVRFRPSQVKAVEKLKK